MRCGTDFDGVIPAIITPMQRGSEGGVDLEALSLVIEWNCARGVHGVWVAGGAGESVLLSDAENRAVATAAVAAARGRCKIIMHVGANTTARSVALARHAAVVGVDAICAVPPFFYGDSRTDAALTAYYREVGAAASELPLFAYNLKDATGVEITPAQWPALCAAVPQLVGVKHSVDDLTPIQDFVRLGAKVYTGQGHLMLPALALGASGCVDGTIGLDPAVWLDIWSAWKVSDVARAQASQERAAQLCNLLLPYGYIPPIKALVGAAIGRDCGEARPPIIPLESEQRRLLFIDARALGLVASGSGKGGSKL